MAVELETENRTNFKASMVAVVGFFAAGIIGTAAAILGSNFQTPGISDADAINV